MKVLFTTFITFVLVSSLQAYASDDWLDDNDDTGDTDYVDLSSFETLPIQKDEASLYNKKSKEEKLRAVQKRIAEREKLRRSKLQLNKTSRKTAFNKK